jgi:hypothetical protein
MTAPIIFIGTHRIKAGRLDQFRREMPDFCRFVEEHEPRLIAFNMYLDGHGMEATVVQVHPDFASMQTHMQLVHEHIERQYAEVLESTTGIQVYGEVGDDTLAMMQQIAPSDVPFTVKQEYVAGFTRAASQTHSPTA